LPPLCGRYATSVSRSCQETHEQTYYGHRYVHDCSYLYIIKLLCPQVHTLRNIP
jgi:hypothetical protein